MAERKNDEVADALAALAGGQVPSETDMASSGIPSESTVFSPAPAKKPAPPAASPPPAAAEFRRPKPAAPGNPSKRPAAPAPPQTSKPQSAAPAPVSPAATMPAARVRATTPQTSPATTSQASDEAPRPARIRPAAPQRPTAPPPPPPEPEPVISETLPEITEDDQMDAPAPDVSTLARTPVHKKKPPHAPIYANLNFRRTLIPILLTNGVMLPLLGLWSLLDSSSPLHAAGTFLTVVLLAAGGILLLLAVLNILHVKHLLEKQAKPI